MRRHLKVAAAAVGAALISQQAWAQLPAGDLRLWLKADSLQVPEDGQITQWVDSSSYGTVFAPRTVSTDDGQLGGSPVEEYPHLETVTVNTRTFPTVRFERAGPPSSGGDPLVDRSGSTDRLWQTTNLTPGADPLAIGDGTSVTSFTVLKPDNTAGGALGFQVVWAKRGNSASLLQLGINAQGRFNYVTYDASVSYTASPVQPAGVWNIVEQTIVEAGANDPIAFASNSTEDPTQPLINLPVPTNGGLIVDRNDGINEDPAGFVEPFGIGTHAQDCCGEGETFAGNIAEIIIYARELSSAERDQVYAYLTDKYLAVPEPSTSLLALAAATGGALVVRRRKRQAVRG